MDQGNLLYGKPEVKLGAMIDADELHKTYFGKILLDGQTYLFEFVHYYPPADNYVAQILMRDTVGGERWIGANHAERNAFIEELKSELEIELAHGFLPVNQKF